MAQVGEESRRLGKQPFIFRLSGFACVSGGKLEACDSFSKPDSVVADHWPIGLDDRRGWPSLEGSRPFRRRNGTAGLHREPSCGGSRVNDCIRPNFVVPRPAFESPKQSFTKFGCRLQSAHEDRAGQMRPLPKPAIRSTGRPGWIRSVQEAR